MSINRTYWGTVPFNSLLVFLLGVFLLFSTIGFASDIPEMGRQPQLRFVLSVLPSGIFPVFYAFAGFALRKDWWKAIAPLLIVHFALMFFQANRLPDRPLPSTMGAAELEALNDRLFRDALAIIIAVVLGYVCFLYVSILCSLHRWLARNHECCWRGVWHREAR